jgi:hypothetical protein
MLEIGEGIPKKAELGTPRNVPLKMGVIALAEENEIDENTEALKEKVLKEKKELKQKAALKEKKAFKQKKAVKEKKALSEDRCQSDLCAIQPSRTRSGCCYSTA